MASRKQIIAAKKNIVKARRAWMKMRPRARRKTMPARNPHPSRRYPVGSYVTLDVGRPGHHYIHAKKTKYGWTHGPLRTYGGNAKTGTLVKKKAYTRKPYSYRRNGKLVHVKRTRVKATKYKLD